MRQVIHVVFILINIFNVEDLSFFSDIMLLFQNGNHGNNKNTIVVFQLSQTIHLLNFMFVSSLQMEIFEIVYC